MQRLGLILFVASIGCGSGDAVAPVQGVVKHNGAPVEGAQVMFIPAKGAAADAMTDAAGKYSLKAAAIGSNQVTVTKMVKKDPADPYSGADNVLPARYAQGESSGITKDVARGGNTFDLDLVD